MINSYPWGPAFQESLTAALIQQPRKFASIIEPSFFTNPLLVDIVKLVKETLKQHQPKIVILNKPTLKEIVKASLGRKGREKIAPYRSLIRRLYEIELGDAEVLFTRAQEFAKESKYRAMLIRSEKHVTTRTYEEIHRLMDVVRAETESTAASDAFEWNNLPQMSDFPQKEVDWAIEGLVPLESAIALSGDEGTGKTLLALSWAKALTRLRTSWAGRCDLRRYSILVWMYPRSRFRAMFDG